MKLRKITLNQRLQRKEISSQVMKKKESLI